MQGLPFQTITEFVALGLTLIAGMFFGLAVAPGGRKWKERYQELDVENAAYRHHAETDLREANQRVQQLEAEMPGCKRHRIPNRPPPIPPR